MKNLSIDIETYSPEPLVKCGVYRYSSHPDFKVLLFGYSADGGSVHVVDFTGRRETAGRCPVRSYRHICHQVGVQCAV